MVVYYLVLNIYSLWWWTRHHTVFNNGYDRSFGRAGTFTLNNQYIYITCSHWNYLWKKDKTKPLKKNYFMWFPMFCQFPTPTFFFCSIKASALFALCLNTIFYLGGWDKRKISYAFFFFFILNTFPSIKYNFFFFFAYHCHFIKSVAVYFWPAITVNNRPIIEMNSFSIWSLTLSCRHIFHACRFSSDHYSISSIFLTVPLHPTKVVFKIQLFLVLWNQKDVS